jgi:hypothetical protein
MPLPLPVFAASSAEVIAPCAKALYKPNFSPITTIPA